MDAFDPEASVLEIPESFPENSSMRHSQPISIPNGEIFLETFYSRLYNLLMHPPGEDTIISSEDQVVPDHDSQSTVSTTQNTSLNSATGQHACQHTGTCRCVPDHQRMNLRNGNQDSNLPNTSPVIEARHARERFLRRNLNSKSPLSKVQKIQKRKNIRLSLLKSPNTSLTSVENQSPLPAADSLGSTRTIQTELSFSFNETSFRHENMHGRLSRHLSVEDTAWTFQEYSAIDISRRTNNESRRAVERADTREGAWNSPGTALPFNVWERRESSILDLRARLRDMTSSEQASHRQSIINQIAYWEELRGVEESESESPLPDQGVPVMVTSHTYRENSRIDNNDNDHCVPEIDVVHLNTSLEPNAEKNDHKKREDSLPQDQVVPNIDLPLLVAESQRQSETVEVEITSQAHLPKNGYLDTNSLPERVGSETPREESNSSPANAGTAQNIVPRSHTPSSIHVGTDDRLIKIPHLNSSDEIAYLKCAEEAGSVSTFTELPAPISRITPHPFFGPATTQGHLNFSDSQMPLTRNVTERSLSNFCSTGGIHSNFRSSLRPLMENVGRSDYFRSTGGIQNHTNFRGTQRPLPTNIVGRTARNNIRPTRIRSHSEGSQRTWQQAIVEGFDFYGNRPLPTVYNSSELAQVIRFDRRMLSNSRTGSAGSSIGYVPQYTSFSPRNVRMNLESGRNYPFRRHSNDSLLRFYWRSTQFLTEPARMGVRGGFNDFVFYFNALRDILEEEVQQELPDQCCPLSVSEVMLQVNLTTNRETDSGESETDNEESSDSDKEENPGFEADLY